MRKRRGIIGYIYGLLSFILIAGILIAVLKQFNGDPIAAISWFCSFVMNLINNVADKLFNTPTFRQMFK